MKDFDEDRSSRGKMEDKPSVSPYATGGGGITFERRVGVKFLAHLLVGDGTVEIGIGRSVVSVAFQQAPDYLVDDLVVSAAFPGESEPSMVLVLAVRRRPNIVQSDESTRKLIRAFVSDIVNTRADGPEHQWGLVVAGSQQHAKQLSTLSEHAATQMAAPGFFDLIHTPRKFSANIRERLEHLENLVGLSLEDLGTGEVTQDEVQRCTWQLLRNLTVSMPRLETPDETDWTALTNSLVAVSRGTNLASASNLRDRLSDLASDYSAKAACVDLSILRRDTHTLLEITVRRNEPGWRVLNLLNQQSRKAVSDVVSDDGSRCVCLRRTEALQQLTKIVTDVSAVVVSGESGVGKSALAVLGLTNTAEEKPDEIQVLCINLRHIPKLSIDLQNIFGVQLSELLSEMSAPQRILIVDGADAVAEGMEDAFQYLVGSARESNIKIVTVTSVDSNEVVQRIVRKHFGDDVKKHVVAPLADDEIDLFIRTFPELQKLNANPKSRELLRRLVVVDLLVRSGIQGVPLSDADAMSEIWSGLVRRHEKTDMGMPDARENVLLVLADLVLQNVDGKERLGVIGGLDSVALNGLRRDGLLRTTPDNPFRIGPEFSHDEVRRYAVARILLADRKPSETLLAVEAPRWSLSAARLACQVLLAGPNKPDDPLQGRFARLQSSFDALVEAGHSVRWADLPSEALISLTRSHPVLQDAWPSLKDDNAAGLKRLSRLIGQQFRNENWIVSTAAIEPIIELLLRDRFPWKSGKYAQELFREWLRGHIVTNTAAGHRLRIQLRSHLLDACKEADRSFVERKKARDAALAARTPEEVERDNLIAALSAHGHEGRFTRSEIPYEITDIVFLELLALLGTDLGVEGEKILRRVGQDAPSMLAPAVEEPLTGRALASYSRGLLVHLTEAYYIDDETNGSWIYDSGIRRHGFQGYKSYHRSAWYFGPFYWLFVEDFRRGVEVLNRLLNHVVHVRMQELSRMHRIDQRRESNDIGMYHIVLEIDGECKKYFGDENMWRWYRGKTMVGPYPCMSALQALERVCDQRLINNDVPIKDLISVLLLNCESLAMIGLIVGLLIRHLEKADHLLDPYLTHPVIWDYELLRVGRERKSSRQAADPEGVVAQERRRWSFHEVAKFMVIDANAERSDELRKLGRQLVEYACQQLELTKDQERAEIDTYQTEQANLILAQVRAWARSLDRNSYEFRGTSYGLEVPIAPPKDITASLRESSKELRRGTESTRLLARYSIKPNHLPTESVAKDELESDLCIVQKWHEMPTSTCVEYSWDTVSALVAAAAINANILHSVNLPEDALFFAALTVLRIGHGKGGILSWGSDFSYYEDGADRSAARAIPLLLLPAAAPIRAAIGNSKELTTRHHEGVGRVGEVIRTMIGMKPKLTASESIAQAGFNLARAPSDEVRLHLARSLDHVWQTPCAGEGRCHHAVGWQLVKETMRDCIRGDFDRKNQRRPTIKINYPSVKSLSKCGGESIIAPRLDAAIRALAPAVTANICISDQAKLLLSALFDAQRRVLLLHRNAGADDRGSHTLISARALLTLAENGDDKALFAHLDAYIDCPALLDTLLRAMSAAAEETRSRADTARRIWPDIMLRVLRHQASKHASLEDDLYRDCAIASLLPNSAGEIPYLYREIQGKPIDWWDPISLRSEVEEWLIHAKGRAHCFDRLICFIRVLKPEEQVQMGVPWITTLLFVDNFGRASQTWSLSDWLIDVRPVAVKVNLLNGWQKIVDAMVVAGDSSLASYSE